MNYRKIIALLLEDESPLVRSSAAVIMGAMESPDTASGKALMQAMKDSESEVRLQAIIGLGKIRYEGALDALLEKFP
ncbi:MAG: HEAT repeat domain-containing protein, partial [Gemmataceae bacterium]